VIQRSPKNTRGRTPWFFSSWGLVSVACANSSVLVSAHRCRPKKNGEFAPTASCGPARSCAAFQYCANRPGDTCRCSCTLVQADSGAIVDEYVASRSTPWMSMNRSSPREEKIDSLSAA
jgi:hypothetical protein